MTRSTTVASATVFVIATAIACALHWPLPLHLADWRIDGAFHHGHLWAFDHVARMVTGATPFSTVTDRIAWPFGADTRFIGWVPALLLAPVWRVLGPLPTYNLFVLASPGLTALATMALLRRWTHAGPWTAAGASLIVAFSGFALGALSNGQVAKVQIWAPMLVLLATERLLDDHRWLRPITLLALATLAMAFTSPSLALLTPLAMGPRLLFRILEDHRTIIRSAVAIVVFIVAMLPARAYYQVNPEAPQSEEAGPLAAFDPGNIHQTPSDYNPENVATIQGLVVRQPAMQANPLRANHLSYLGWGLLLAAAWLSTYAFPQRALGWTLVAVGAGFAMGPQLMPMADPVQLWGWTVPAPGVLLKWSHYPLADTGMYYRAALVASLGLATLVAGGGAQLGRARALVWLIALGSVADTVHMSARLWPEDVGPVPAQHALEQMADDPVQGAVLDLPLWVSPHIGTLFMEDAVFHGRPTSAIPRDTFDIPAYEHTATLLRDALQSPDASAVLRDAGYRYVIARPFINLMVSRTQTQRRAMTQVHDLELVLGPPTIEDELHIWRLSASSASESPASGGP